MSNSQYYWRYLWLGIFTLMQILCVFLNYYLGYLASHQNDENAKLSYETTFKLYKTTQIFLDIMRFILDLVYLILFAKILILIKYSAGQYDFIKTQVTVFFLTCAVSLLIRDIMQSLQLAIMLRNVEDEDREMDSNEEKHVAVYQIVSFFCELVFNLQMLFYVFGKGRN